MVDNIDSPLKQSHFLAQQPQKSLVLDDDTYSIERYDSEFNTQMTPTPISQYTANHQIDFTKEIKVNHMQKRLMVNSQNDYAQGFDYSESKQQQQWDKVNEIEQDSLIQMREIQLYIQRQNESYSKILNQMEELSAHQSQIEGQIQNTKELLNEEKIMSRLDEISSQLTSKDDKTKKDINNFKEIIISAVKSAMNLIINFEVTLSFYIINIKQNFGTKIDDITRECQLLQTNEVILQKFDMQFPKNKLDSLNQSTKNQFQGPLMTFKENAKQIRQGSEVFNAPNSFQNQSLEQKSYMKQLTANFNQKNAKKPQHSHQTSADYQSTGRFYQHKNEKEINEIYSQIQDQMLEMKDVNGIKILDNNLERDPLKGIQDMSKIQFLESQYQSLNSTMRDRAVDVHRSMLPAAVDEISFDFLDLLSEDNTSKLKQYVNDLIQKHEGFDLEIYEGELPIFSDKVWVQDLTKQEECVIVITAQYLYLISLNTTKLLYQPIKLTLIDQFLTPYVKIKSCAFKLLNTQILGISHLILKKNSFGESYQYLIDFVKLARVRLSLSFLITQTDSFEIQSGTLSTKKSQFTFASLQIVDDFAKFNKINMLSFMSGHIKKKVMTWRDKFIASAANGRWKDRFMILSNFGLFEFSLQDLEKPKHIYSLKGVILDYDKAVYEIASQSHKLFLENKSNDSTNQQIQSISPQKQDKIQSNPNSNQASPQKSHNLQKRLQDQDFEGVLRLTNTEIGIDITLMSTQQIYFKQWIEQLEGVIEGIKDRQK
eukprot:403372570